ncbi:MAG TPA: hypothetical protein VIG93_09680, partial [Gaiellaceae bacterium]
MTRKAAALIAAVLALGGAAAGLVIAAGGANAGSNAQTVKFSASDLFVEINATDGDAGLQLNLDGEPWSTLELVDPSGRVLMEVDNSSELKSYGLTGLTFESAEPPFDEQPLSEFTAKFPEGLYRFTGTTVDGRNIMGQDRLTHVFPVGPVVTAPTEGAVVSSSDLVVTWLPVTQPNGVKIVQYEVIVSNADTGKDLSVELPPSAT